MAGQRGHRGFTLLELVLVLALVALASLLAASSLRGGFAGMQLRGSAQELASQLRFTRTLAIASGEAQQFTIAPLDRRWTAPKGREGVVPQRLAVTFYGARDVQPSAGEGAILFFPDGASTGGRIRLARDTATWQVEVAWLTGEVRVAAMRVP